MIKIQITYMINLKNLKIKFKNLYNSKKKQKKLFKKEIKSYLKKIILYIN